MNSNSEIRKLSGSPGFLKPERQPVRSMVGSVVIGAVLLALCLISSVKANDSVIKRVAPTPVLPSFSGQYIHFSDYFKANNKAPKNPSVLVIKFMGLNCPPCEVELPQFLEVVRPLSKDEGNGLKYFLISVDPLSANAELRTYLDGKGIDADKEVLLDPYRRAAQQFGVKGIPRTFVISPEGLIIADIEGAVADYKERLSEGIMSALGEAKENE